MKFPKVAGIVLGLCCAVLVLVNLQSSAAATDLESLWTTTPDTYYVAALSPLQGSEKQIQAPLKQEVQAPLKQELQAPSKLPVSKRQCFLIPGRATRLARRADRLEDRITRPQDVRQIRASITSLEPLAPPIGGTSSVVSQEPGVCGSGTCSNNCGRRGLLGRRR